MSLGHRSFLASIWAFGSVAVQAIVQLLVIAVLARYLIPAEFGLVAIANMAVGFLVMFSEIGVGAALIQKPKLSDIDISSAFTFSVLLGILGVLLLWFTAPYIANYFGSPDAEDILRVLSLSLVLTSYNSVAYATLERELNLKRLALVNISSYSLAFGVLGVTLAVSGAGVWAIVIAMLSQGVLRMVFIGKVNIRFSLKALRSEAFTGIIKYGAGMSLSRIINYAGSQVDNLIVGKILGIAMLGFYQMAFQIMDLPRRFLGSVIDKVMFSAMSRMDGDLNRLASAYLRSTELVIVLMLPISVLGIILAPEIVEVYLGDQWLEIVIPLQLLLLQVPLRGSNRLADQLGGALGRNYSIARRKFAYLVMVAISVLIGSKWGLAGVALALTIVVLINYFVMTHMALGMIESNWKRNVSALLPGVIIAIIILIVGGTSISILRDVTDSNLTRIIVTLTTSIIAVGASILIYPTMLGSSGTWLIKKVTGMMSR